MLGDGSGQRISSANILLSRFGATERPDRDQRRYPRRRSCDLETNYPRMNQSLLQPRCWPPLPLGSSRELRLSGHPADRNPGARPTRLQADSRTVRAKPGQKVPTGMFKDTMTNDGGGRVSLEGITADYSSLNCKYQGLAGTKTLQEVACP